MTDDDGTTDADTDADAGEFPEDGEATAREGPIEARYYLTDDERVLSFLHHENGHTAAVAQNREGYAMLKVRASPGGDELERYYGFEMALDHAAELLGVRTGDLPVPDPAADMGM